MRTRRITIAVRQWSSEESIHTWKYCKQHLLQPKDGSAWSDHVTLVHVAGGKSGKGEGRPGKGEREKERQERDAWDSGGPTIPDAATALLPYKNSVQALEVAEKSDAASALVDYVNKEGMDILVLASRGRGAVKKAMMGSTTEQVMVRAACACLVVKPQVGAGDTFRMKTAASSSGAASLSSPGGGLPPPPRSPVASPMFGARGGAGGVATPFNRRVAIAYDTTASGRYLLKWAAENILEPADNIFVARAVPRMQRPGTSFADKNSVQRLAGDALSGLPHITTFNIKQQGNARKAVLDFVAKESVDLLIIGMYKGMCNRKGLGRRGNATTIYNRCGCPVMVVPMSEAALVVAVKAAELEAAAAEEAELSSDSDSDSSESGDDDGADHESPPGSHWATVSLPYPKAFMETLADKFNTFKRRSSGPQTDPGGAGAGAGASAGHSPPDARRGGPLMLAGAGLSAGRYILEVDAAGAIKSINPLAGSSGSGESGGEPEEAGAAVGARRHSSTGSADAAAAAVVAAGELHARLLRQQREISDLRAQLSKLSAGGGRGGSSSGISAPAGPESEGAAAAAAVVEAALVAADAKSASEAGAATVAP